MTSWIIAFSHRLNTQEACNKVVCTEPFSLVYVPNRFKMQAMCNDAVRSNSAVPHFVPDRFKTQEMCIKAVQVGLFHLSDVLITL